MKITAGERTLSEVVAYAAKKYDAEELIIIGIFSGYFTVEVKVP